MSKVLASADLRYKGACRTAPAHRGRLAANANGASGANAEPARMLRGFAMGSAVSAIAPRPGFSPSCCATTTPSGSSPRWCRRICARCSGHLTDVISHRPAHRKTLVQRQARRGAAGDRLDHAGFYADRGPARLRRRAPIGAIVYRRRLHVINLFVAQTPSTETRAPKTDTFQGFNIRRWSEGGLNFWAVLRPCRRRARRIQRQVSDSIEERAGVRCCGRRRGVAEHQSLTIIPAKAGIHTPRPHDLISTVRRLSHKRYRL